MNNLALLVIIFTVNEALGVGSIGGYDDIAEGLADLNSNLSEMKKLFSSSLTSIDGEYLRQTQCDTTSTLNILVSCSDLTVILLTNCLNIESVAHFWLNECRLKANWWQAVCKPLSNCFKAIFKQFLTPQQNETVTT